VSAKIIGGGRGAILAPPLVKTFIMTTIGDGYQVAEMRSAVKDNKEEGRDKLGGLLSASYKFDT
jgi:hypothetical protein